MIAKGKRKKRRNGVKTNRKRSNYWDNPKEFFPERFTDRSINYKGQHLEFLPFGAGRRGCPGMHMEMAMVELTLANLLCCFDWKLPDGMKETDIDMDEASGLTTYKKFPLINLFQFNTNGHQKIKPNQIMVSYNILEKSFNNMLNMRMIH
ncbi:Cytochrome P450 [Morus notabilis]|uniref:Cytochrome P450 n=1 Tax=Morus notabilis TaxID=981085 RepID=W9RCM4_9ROSA|nr:Cytochrome P450 [Morus notabilis]